MRVIGRFPGAVLALAFATALTMPAGATTLIRQSLGDLVAKNGTIVLGEVVEARSYWNEEGTFILTDVQLSVQEVLKGAPGARDLTITVMGGTVEDLTTLIVGGAQLVPGRSYLVFLGHEDLPGVKKVQTVRHHSQGVFEIEMAKDGLRAISQASREPLATDARGIAEAPGGAEGLPLGSMMRSIRELIDRPQDSRQEVQ